MACSIDVVGRLWRSKLRILAKSDRRAIEGLAAEAYGVEWFDVAAAAYMAAREKLYPRHPGIQAVRRLARRYIRLCRREIVSQRRFLEVAARQALMGAG
jgi:hypothetical protein